MNANGKKSKTQGARCSRRSPSARSPKKKAPKMVRGPFKPPEKRRALSLSLPPSQRFPLYMVPAAGATLPLKSGSEAKLSVPCPPPASSSISTISLFPVLSKGPGTYCRVCGPLDGQ